MKRLLRFVTIYTALISCNEQKDTATKKILEFGAFTIETPGGWEKLKLQGIDSYVGDIAIDDSDTLHFDLGWYSNDLTEYQEIKMPNGKTYYIGSNDTASNPTLIDSINKDDVVKSYISWDTIDGRRTKVLSQMKPGIGTTGIYIDSLWQAGSDIDKFNLYGKHLKPENEKAALLAFKTLKFYKKK